MYQRSTLCAITGLTAGAACVLAAPHASADTVWIGGVNGGDGISIFQEENWDTDGNVAAPYTTPAAGSLDPNTALAIDDYTMTSATLTGIGTLRLGNAATTMTFDGTSVTTAGATGSHGAGTLNLNNSSLFHVQFVNSALVVNIDATSELRLKGAGSPIPNATINLDPAGGTLTFANGTPGTLNPSSIINAGSGNPYMTTGDISADFTFTGTQAAPTSITAVPEPASAALLGLGALTMLRRRR